MFHFRLCDVMSSRMIVAAFVIMGAIALAAPADGPAKAKEIQVGDYRISGPINHDNLSIYLIRGPETVKGKHYATLQEALERKIIKVYETGSVNRLMIENTSETDEVYIQSGDIVKGGQQDRTIAMDFVCPPKSKLPIDAFCVEHGRWSKRGREEAGQFSSANHQVAGNALKVAVKGASDQNEVWKQVEVLQNKSTLNTGVRVNAVESASSLQLSLENRKLDEMTNAYVKEMTSLAEPADVIGYAFSINGKVKCADVYGSHELFAKLWPRLLKASAVEAVADLQKDKKFEPATLEAVKACIQDAEKGKSSEKKVTERIQMICRETDGNLVYETRDRSASQAAEAAWIHRNYLVKDEETKAALKARENRPEQRQGMQQERINRAPNPGENRQQQAIPDPTPNR